MLLPGNVCIFQWYFTVARSFSVIFRRSRSFGAMRPIFPRENGDGGAVRRRVRSFRARRGRVGEEVEWRTWPGYCLSPTGGDAAFCLWGRGRAKDSFSKKARPRKLVSLCLGTLGQHLEDIIPDISEFAAFFPPHIKLAILSIARRRRLLNDEVLMALAESSWEILDVSGSDVTDVGLATVANVCSNLRAVDISRCEKITTAGVSEIVSHCLSLETLRCGGCPRSEFTARRCLSLLKPKLNTLEEDSWEELDTLDIGGGAESLRWLVWPKIDDNSKETLAAECPRVTINPQPSLYDLSGSKVPVEALASVPLDHSILEDVDPRTWAVSAAPRRPVVPPNPNAPPEIPIAERFRLAYVEREARLAPKRAKRERQQRRRAERDYMMNDIDARSVALAAQASRNLRKS